MYDRNDYVTTIKTSDRGEENYESQSLRDNFVIRSRSLYFFRSHSANATCILYRCIFYTAQLYPTYKVYKGDPEVYRILESIDRGSVKRFVTGRRKEHPRVAGRPVHATSRSSAVESRHKCRHKRDSIVSLYIVSPAAGRKSNSVLFGRIYTGIRYSERGPRHIKIERAQ